MTNKSVELFEAVSGPKGCLDAWLEVHDEAEVRAAIKGLMSSTMTMRDEFAAKAMQGDWAAQDASIGEFMTDATQVFLENRASVYYRMADAMLKVRDQQP